MFISTKDLYAAAFLVSRGAQISKLENHNGSVHFFFNESSGADRLLTEFFTSPAHNVSARDYSSQIRQLKGLIHSNLSIR